MHGKRPLILSIIVTPYWGSQYWGNGRVHVEVDVWSHRLQVHTSASGHKQINSSKFPPFCMSHASSKVLLKSRWLSRAITLQLAHLAQKMRCAIYYATLSHWASLPANSYPQMWHQQNQQLGLHVRDLPWPVGPFNLKQPRLFRLCDESASRTCRAQFSVAGDNAYLSFRQEIVIKSGHTFSEIWTLLPKSGP